ncbi:MAG: hypothetical protein HRU21_10270, partial [Pseudomonadales bacterium]|nr:hypothetical protein [Pseudomonadales bacterium]
ASNSYLAVFLITPFVCYNIYAQQYQMHRFVQQYYQQPAAVNDLGLLSYQNPHYVLDLWGLASKEALAFRQTSDDLEWMHQLVEQSDIDLVMIYPSWFEKEGKTLPEQWQKLAVLRMNGRVNFLDDDVSFYCTVKNCDELTQKLQSFALDLSPASILLFENQD